MLYDNRLINGKLSVTRIATWEEYQLYSIRMAGEYTSRENYEKSIIQPPPFFSIPGICYPCQQTVSFSVDYIGAYNWNEVPFPNLIERIICPQCQMNTRMRLAIHLLREIVRPDHVCSFYIAEQLSPLFRWIQQRYLIVVGSEFFGEGIPSGFIFSNGLRHEDFTRLSFSKEQFDAVLSFDVFEHIFQYRKAFQECFRVLKPMGTLLFTVPFQEQSPLNIVRAIKKDTGEIQHFLPPEYHGNPNDPNPCLAFYHFGWEMLDQLREAGFSNTAAYCCWSPEFAYLGGEPKVFIATKP